MYFGTTLEFITGILLPSGIVSGLISLLVKSWTDKRLEAYKRAQQQGFEDYKNQLNSRFNRITKIHEKEIEVLPCAWQKLQEAHGHLARLVQPFRIEREISQMDERQLAEYQQEYEEISTAFMAFHNYLLNNSIFLSPDLYPQFKAVDDLFHRALVKSGIARQGLARGEFALETFDDIYHKVEPIKESIRELVQKRLRYQDAE